jgi:hypothetical protein
VQASDARAGLDAIVWVDVVGRLLRTSSERLDRLGADYPATPMQVCEPAGLSPPPCQERGAAPVAGSPQGSPQTCRGSESLLQYRKPVAVVHPSDGLPPGQVYHAAGETQGGVLIAAVWNSKEDSDRFVSETLLAKLPIDGGLVGPPEERGAEVANLQTA